MKRITILIAALALAGVAGTGFSQNTPRGASPGGGKADMQQGTEKRTVFVCPMHPEIRSDVQGKCPKCGMKLVAQAVSAGSSADGERRSEARPRAGG